MVGPDIIWGLSKRISYDVSRAPSVGVGPDIGYALIRVGRDVLQHDISRAPSARLGPDIGYAFN